MLCNTQKSKYGWTKANFELCVRHLKRKNIEDDDFSLYNKDPMCVASSIYVSFVILLPSNIQGIIILH